MKILHLIQKPQFRGAELFATQLSNVLLDLGHQAVLVTVFRGDAALPFQGQIRHLNLSDQSTFLDISGFKKLAMLVSEIQPDIVQANAGDTLRYAVLSKWIYGWKQPIVFRNASIVSLYIRSLPVKWFYRLLYRKADYIISVSRNSKADFLRLFPFAESKIESIPIGIDINRQASNHSPYPGNQLKLVHVGGFTYEKNHDGLIRIFDGLLRQFPDLQLWLVGDGPLRKSIEENVVLKGLKGQIFFTGYINNPMDYIAHADALVLSSIIEGLPGVILEAQYCKTPVVAYDVGGISEVIKSGETGWLVRKGDEEEFVNTTTEALRLGKADVQRIVDIAYCQVVEQYDNRVIAKRFLEVYMGLIGRGRVDRKDAKG